MAFRLLSSLQTEVYAVDTTSSAGGIVIPSAAAKTGQKLVLKDSVGSWGSNPLTLSTPTGSLFEDGTAMKVLREPYGFLSLVSDGLSKWYVEDGTHMTSMTVSSLQIPLFLSNSFLSTPRITANTLSFQDTILNTVNPVFTQSSLLYYGTEVIGGTQVGPTQFIPFTVSFSPRSISGLQLWLDAADTTSIVLSGNSVIRWNDKSGNQNNAISQTTNNPTFQQNTLNSQATIGFQSSNDVLLVSANNFNMNTYPSLCYFIVMRPATTQPNITYGGILSTDTLNQFGRSLGLGGGNWQQEYYNGFQNITPYTANVWSIVSLQFTSTTSTTLAVNGSTSAATATGVGNNTEGLKIGSYGFTSNYGAYNANFDTSEILVYGANLTTEQRQQLEGYFAWKWGLVANLSSNHPYKSVPP